MTTTVSHVARWADAFASLSGAPHGMSLRFSEGWIVGTGRPPFGRGGGIYVFAEAEGAAVPLPIAMSRQRVLDVGKTNDNLVGRITDHLPLCKGRRIVVYSIEVDRTVVGRFTPHFPTCLEKYVFSCMVRLSGCIADWNSDFSNGKPNERVEPLPGARTPTGADIARWALEFADLTDAPDSVCVEFASVSRTTGHLGNDHVGIVTMPPKGGDSCSLETSCDPVIAVNRFGFPSSATGDCGLHTIAVTSSSASRYRKPLSRALEFFLKYSFIRCAGVPPVYNDNRKRR